MNAEDLDLFREKILRVCQAANVMGVPRERIVRLVQSAGYAVNEGEVDAQLRHLKSAGFIAAVEGASLTPALARYATTAAGDHELEKRGFLP